MQNTMVVGERVEGVVDWKIEERGKKKGENGKKLL